MALPEISPLELQIQTMTEELNRLPEDKAVWSLLPTGEGNLALDLKLKVTDDKYISASRIFTMKEIPTASKDVGKIVDAYLLCTAHLDKEEE